MSSSSLSSIFLKFELARRWTWPAKTRAMCSSCCAPSVPFFSSAAETRLITQAIGAETSDARRTGLAAAIFIAFQKRRDLSASAWEPLAQLATRVLEPRALSTPLRAGAMTDIWNEINHGLPAREDCVNIRMRLERNYVLSGFPELWMRIDWKDALDQFRSDLNLFNIDEAME